MRLTTKGRYALRAMLRLATYESDKPEPLRVIAEKEEISVEYLNQLFFQLRKAGLIRATRGPGGGFHLDRDPAEISVKDILDAVGEEIAVASGDEGATGKEAIGDAMWLEAAGLVEGYFAGVTLQKILEDRKSGNADALL